MSSRLDYCNSLLYGIPKQELARLQRLQNSAARLVTRSSRREHITPLLHKLHWLSVDKRITFKLALLTYNALHDIGPSYLCELLTVYRPTRTLRSSDQSLLVEPPFRTICYGQKAFVNAAPRIWNSLPVHIRECTTKDTFKSNLKTYLFSL